MRSYALLRRRLHQFLECSRRQQQQTTAVRLFERLWPGCATVTERQPSFHAKAMWYTMNAEDILSGRSIDGANAADSGPSLTVAYVCARQARAVCCILVVNMVWRCRGAAMLRVMTAQRELKFWAAFDGARFGGSILGGMFLQ